MVRRMRRWECSISIVSFSPTLPFFIVLVFLLVESEEERESVCGIGILFCTVCILLHS